jgi:hypothetical protein
MANSRLHLKNTVPRSPKIAIKSVGITPKINPNQLTNGVFLHLVSFR